MSKKVFVIIVTYNGMKWIDKCLRSLVDSSYPAEVVVVDNLSKDGTLDYIRSNFPTVHILANTENLGFGKANNKGISYALAQGADFVFLINQDVYIEKNTIEGLLDHDFENVGVLSPIHQNGDATALDHNFATYISVNNTILFDLLKNKSRKRLYEVPFVNAAAWFIPAPTFDLIGGFDPLFTHYGEDDNFAARVNYHGLKVCVDTNTFICHDRMVYGNLSVFRKKKFYRVSLLILSDIYTKISFVKYAHENIRLLFEPGFSLRNIIEFFKDQTRILFSIRKIRKSREMNKEKGRKYL